ALPICSWASRATAPTSTRWYRLSRACATRCRSGLPRTPGMSSIGPDCDLVIVVPYLDRQSYLDVFVDRVPRYVESQEHRELPYLRRGAGFGEHVQPGMSARCTRSAPS